MNATTRRRLLGVALALLAAVCVHGARASNILETQTFVLTLPDGWERNLRTDPVSARGPQGEMLEISSRRIAGPPGESSERSALRAEIEAAGIRTLRQGEAEPDLVVERAVTRSVVAGGAVLNDVVYRSRNADWKFAQFVVVGPRTAVFVSLRVPGKHAASIDALRDAIGRIRWVAE